MYKVGDKVTIRFGCNIPAGNIFTIKRDGLESMRFMLSTNHTGIVR